VTWVALVGMAMSAAEQVELLLDWQEQEWVVLESWWEARNELDTAVKMHRRLVRRRDRQMARIAGSTSRQRSWIERHRAARRVPTGAVARERIRRLTYRRRQLDACAARWSSRTDAAGVEVTVAARRLAVASTTALAVWDAERAKEMTGMSRRQLSWIARRCV
jgi:hypothetical protein